MKNLSVCLRHKDKLHTLIYQTNNQQKYAKGKHLTLLNILHFATSLIPKQLVKFTFCPYL